MLDKDIIEDVGFHGHYETEDAIAKNIEWLFRQISIVIKRKRTELSDKKPGAVYSSDPKVVVVDMLKRPLQFPNDSNMQLIAQLRSCYNLIVNDAAQHFGFNRMYIESCSSEYLFDKIGNLTNEGKAEYWNEVNKLVEKLDCRKIKLLPKVDERAKKAVF